VVDQSLPALPAAPAFSAPARPTRLDAFLLLAVTIWGANYSVVKAALREIPPVPFNALRLSLASLMFLAAIGWGREASSPASGRRGLPGLFSGRDWMAVAALGFVGHFVYQLLFMGGLDRTTAANSSLLLGCSPVFVAVFTAALGHERIRRIQWGGILLSALGIYLVVGRHAAVSRSTLAGDFMSLGAALCWSAVTVGSRPLLLRYSPVAVTGVAMTVGALLYLPTSWLELRQLNPWTVSAATWMALLASASLALFASYLIWFTGVQRLGNTRTSVYSNLVPLAGMFFAWLWLDESIGWTKIAGAGAILSGVILTRLGPASLGYFPTND
jgi:drug/metabolite transporter (DMT)-like permease